MSSDKIEEIPKLIKDAANRQYIPGDKLGAGGFASVFRAKMIDRRTPPEASDCALKVVRAKIKSEQLRTRFQFELGIHNKLQHPNIVGFYRAFTHHDLTYVSLELCEHGSLTDMVKKRKYLTMPEIRRFLIQLCGAVKYLHSRDVVHRDIKAGNIFLDSEMNVKLGDFGLASVMVQNSDLSSYARRTTFCGTPNYLAPEVLSRSGHDKAVDIWAIGILAYYLSVGRAPFHSKSKDEIYQRVRNADYGWPEPSADANEIPDALKDLVGTLLVPEEQRPLPDQIVKHPFFSQGFIPDKIDPLARTRRPRWARVPPRAQSETNQAYEKLCKESCVGTEQPPAPATISKKRKKRDFDGEELLAISAEKEFAAGIQLSIPLPEDFVYLAWARPQKKQALPSVILEDEEPREAPPAPTISNMPPPPKPQLQRSVVKHSMAPPPVPSVRSRPATMRRVLVETTANKGAAPEKRTAQDVASKAKSTLTATIGRAKRPRRAGACYE